MSQGEGCGHDIRLYIMVWVCLALGMRQKWQNACRRDVQLIWAFCFSANAVSDDRQIPIPLQVSTDAPSLRKTDLKGRSALLADIQQGTRLRKVTQINDRSAPQIESKWAAQRSLLGAHGGVEQAQTDPALAGLHLQHTYSQTTSDTLKGQTTPWAKESDLPFQKSTVGRGWGIFSIAKQQEKKKAKKSKTKTPS